MMLLPCPFCGERLVEKSDPYLTWFMHADESAPCPMRLVNLFDDDDAAQWNRRADIAPSEHPPAPIEVDDAPVTIASLFKDVEHLDDLPPVARDVVARFVDEAKRASWEAGFTEGLTKSAADPVVPKVHVSSAAGAPARIDGYGVGDHVEIVGGDHTFAGIIVAAFPKLWGAARFVVEDQRGVLHIYGAKNLRVVPALGR